MYTLFVVLCISLCMFSVQGAVMYKKSSTKFTPSSTEAHGTATPSTKVSEIQTLSPDPSNTSPIPANLTTNLPPKETEQSEDYYYDDDGESEEDVEDSTFELICTLFGNVGCNVTCATISYFYDTPENTGACDEHLNCNCKPELKLKNQTIKEGFEKTEDTLQNLINEFFQIPKHQNSRLNTVSSPVSVIADKYDSDYKTLQEKPQALKNQNSANTESNEKIFKDNSQNENMSKYIKNEINRKANPALKKYINMKSAVGPVKNILKN